VAANLHRSQTWDDRPFYDRSLEPEAVPSGTMVRTRDANVVRPALTQPRR